MHTARTRPHALFAALKLCLPISIYIHIFLCVVVQNGKTLKPSLKSTKRTKILSRVIAIPRATRMNLSLLFYTWAWQLGTFLEHFSNIVDIYWTHLTNTVSDNGCQWASLTWEVEEKSQEVELNQVGIFFESILWNYIFRKNIFENLQRPLC